MEPSGVILLVLLAVLAVVVLWVVVGALLAVWEWLRGLWDLWLRFVKGRISWIPLTLISCLLIYSGSVWGVRNSSWWWILAILASVFLVAFLSTYRYTHKERTRIVQCMPCKKTQRTVSEKASAWVDISENNRGGYSGNVHYSPGWSDTIENTYAVFECPSGKSLEFNLKYSGKWESDLEEWKYKYGTLTYNKRDFFSFYPSPDQEKARALFESMR